jgi:hypothetical protein
MTFHRFAGAASIALSFACVLAAPSQAQTFAARDVQRFPGERGGALIVSPANDYVATSGGQFEIDPQEQSIAGPIEGENSLAGYDRMAASADGLWQYRQQTNGSQRFIEVFSFDPATRASTKRTNTLIRSTGSSGSGGEVVVSPDGRWLATVQTLGSSDTVAVAALVDGLPVAEGNVFPRETVGQARPAFVRFSGDGEHAFAHYGAKSANGAPEPGSRAHWTVFRMERDGANIVATPVSAPVETSSSASVWLTDPAGLVLVGLSPIEARVDIHRFDPATGALSWEKAIFDPRLAGAAAAFSQDGTTLATTYSDQVHLWLWDRDNLVFVHRDQAIRLGASFTSLAFSPDGGLLVGADATGIGHLGAFFIEPPQVASASSGWTSR